MTCKVFASAKLHSLGSSGYIPADALYTTFVGSHTSVLVRRGRRAANMRIFSEGAGKSMQLYDANTHIRHTFSFFSSIQPSGTAGNPEKMGYLCLVWQSLHRS